MEFRKAKKEDVVDIVKMLSDDELGAEREKYQQPLPQQYYDAFQKINDDINQELMVVEDEKGEVIGTFQLSLITYLTYQGGIRYQIEAVRVRRDKRGQGIGKLMFKWAIERAKTSGAHVLQLTTDKKRPDAIRFYENLGFNATHQGMKIHFK